jgi:hypothetical protein
MKGLPTSARIGSPVAGPAILAVALLGVLSSGAQSLQRPRFLDAVQRGDIEVEIRGASDEEANQGPAVEVTARNRTSEAMKTTIEVGTLLEASDPETQDLVVARALPLYLEPAGEADPLLYVFCTEISKHPPTTRTRYRPTGMAQGELQKLLRHVDANGLHLDAAAQLAVWAITDNATARDVLSHDWGAIMGLLDSETFTDNAREAQSILDACGVERAFFDPQADYFGETVTIWSRKGFVLARLVGAGALLLIVLLAVWVRARE